jgi:septal ring factor EnvC (AmiA/AmiB activator)
MYNLPHFGQNFHQEGRIAANQDEVKDMLKQEGKGSMRKKGAMVVMGLCLVGSTAFTTYYTLDQAEKVKEEQQKIADLTEEWDLTEEQTSLSAKGEDEQEETAEDDWMTASAKEDVKEETLNEEVLNEEAAEEEMAREETEEDESASRAAASSSILSAIAYDDTTALTWPVAGNVILDYSMDGTIYFSTLDQYKYNPALIIGAETGGQVVASAGGIVESIEVLEETGTTITLNLGNEYELVYGQLKEVAVSAGEVVSQGQLLGYVSEPTKYYCEEGSNLYFAMKKEGEPVDPFLYLESE